MQHELLSAVDDEPRSRMPACPNMLPNKPHATPFSLSAMDLKPTSCHLAMNALVYIWETLFNVKRD